MADMEKVISGLHCRAQDLMIDPPACDGCRYQLQMVNRRGCDYRQLCRDTLALLKERPEIVRCRDCKYRMTNRCIIFQNYGGTKYDDWYCGDGVKKDDK